MKKVFLTLDLEEWYHLEYVKPFAKQIDSDQKFVPQVIPFLKKMADEKIYLTVFVLGEVAFNNPEVVQEIAAMGHEIGCHGLQHDLVYELSLAEFKAKTTEAKRILEELTGSPVKGYRAPCFSMEIEKVDILKELGFCYDASYIRFNEHELYNVMDLSAFTKVESLAYRKSNFYEFEIPTLNLFGKSVPISGGGYFRLFPLWLMKSFMKLYWKNENNFSFYIHPFELSTEKLNHANRMGFKNHFRFQVGRRTSLNRMYSYIRWLQKQQVRFVRYSDYQSEFKY